MKKVLAMVMVIIVSIFANTAIAGPCDQISVNGLNDSQIIDIKKKCVDTLSQVQSTPAVTVDNMAEYAELGKKYGVALSEVAKSLGTTANELAQTPVGEFMLFLVGYRVMGNDILGVIGSVFWFFTMIPLWIYLFNRMVLANGKEINEKYDSQGKLVGIEKHQYPIKWDGPTGATAAWLLVILAVICAAGLIVAFA